MPSDAHAGEAEFREKGGDTAILASIVILDIYSVFEAAFRPAKLLHARRSYFAPNKSTP